MVRWSADLGVRKYLPDRLFSLSLKVLNRMPTANLWFTRGAATKDESGTACPKDVDECSHKAQTKIAAEKYVFIMSCYRL